MSDEKPGVILDAEALASKVRELRALSREPVEDYEKPAAMPQYQQQPQQQPQAFQQQPQKPLFQQSSQQQTQSQFQSQQHSQAQQKQAGSDTDKELLEFMEKSMPKIAVVGCGGSGCNTVSRLSDIGVVGSGLFIVNTDAQHLIKSKAEKKLLIGKMKTRGMGAGSNPEIGEAAAMESIQDLRELLKGKSLVFVTGGMGGGTGTGCAHVVAKAAKDEGALVIAIVTTPFISEGPKRMSNALLGLDKLKKEADTVITIPNERLLQFVGNQPLNSAFKASDMVLSNAVKGLIEVITKPGLVNLDFADVRTILEKSKMALIAMADEGKGDANKNRALIAAEKALTSPLVDADFSTASKALINVIGGESLTLGESESAVAFIGGKIAKDAHIIWGATIDTNLPNDAVRVVVVLSGMSEVSNEDKKKAAEELIDSIA